MDESQSTPATRDVVARGITHRTSVIGSVSSAEQAAAARGVPLAALIKSLVVRRAESDYVFALVPGDRVIDWSKLRDHLGVSRLSMPPADEAFKVTGYVRGTITPFGSSGAWPVVIDSSLTSFEEVALGGGGLGIGIHLDPRDLVQALGADVAEITKSANP